MSLPEILVLEVAKGPAKGSQHRVFQDEKFLVGRQTSACRIMDCRMSREHFVISADDQGWIIRDLNSANGTFVNGEQISGCGLRSGDSILAGDTLFRVFVETNSNETEKHHPTQNSSSFAFIRSIFQSKQVP